MKAHFTHLPTRTWLMLVVPAVVLAYPLAKIVLPTLVHALVPEAVRTLLSML